MRASQHLKKLYKESKLCDLTLMLKNGEKLKVHRMVVSSCPFFQAACSGSFKEADERVIHFPDDDPQAMKWLVAVLYGFSVFECGRIRPSTTSTFATTVGHMFELADKYDVPELVMYAKQRVDAVVSYWHLEEAQPPVHLQRLLRVAYDEERELVWLRNRLRRWAQGHTELLLRNPMVLQELLVSCPMFAVDLAMNGGLDGKSCRVPRPAPLGGVAGEGH